MPKSKKNRKKKNISRSNKLKKQKSPTQFSFAEASPNTDLFTYIIQRSHHDNLFFFTKTLIEKAEIQFHSDEKEWFELFDKLLSTNADFLLNFIFSVYYKEKSTYFLEQVSSATDILVTQLNQGCSESLKNEVLNTTHLYIGLFGSSKKEELEERIEWYTITKLFLVLDSVKAIYTSVFLDSVYKRIELERKLAEF